MDTKKSAINRAMGAQIAAEKSGMRPKRSVEWLAERTGLSDSTVNRILSENPRDIHITAIARFAEVFGLTPQELVQRAVDRAERDAMSEAPATVGDELARKRAENTSKYTGDDFNEEGQPRAAITDPELEQDEP